jgi:hypothetical protein
MDVKCRRILKNSFLFLFESIFLTCEEFWLCVCVKVSQINCGGIEKTKFWFFKHKYFANWKIWLLLVKVFKLREGVLKVMAILFTSTLKDVHRYVWKRIKNIFLQIIPVVFYKAMKYKCSHFKTKKM